MAIQHQGPRCPECIYFERVSEGHGECRRYAPRPNDPMFIPKSDALGTFKNDVHWPKVYDSNWCGEFTSRIGG